MLNTGELDVRWRGYLVLCAVKMLLFPAYHSTDFEVHRNWLSITGTLPTSRWYTEDTSEWTLDYPPMFAWFEYGLAKAAPYVDPSMLDISSKAYSNAATVFFQRSSVIVTDSVLASAAWFGTRKLKEPRRSVAFLLTVANGGLLLVDHIHFQYNGMLIGILLWAILLLREGHHLLGATLFAVLLNLKHLFASLAPLFFVYLLRHYCQGPQALARFAKLGSLVVIVFAASMGPFIAMGQLQQVLGRLFPFGRGLCHAYWAANLWALYSAADKVLAVVLPRIGIHVQRPQAYLAGGLVQSTEYAVLHNVSPAATLAVVLLSMAPCLGAMWRKPDARILLRAAAYASLCSFMGGYHVHEKAILPVTVLMAIEATDSPSMAAEYLISSTAGHFALLPLLFTQAEYPIKVLLWAMTSLGAFISLTYIQHLQGKESEENLPPSKGERQGRTEIAQHAAGATRCSMLSQLERVYLMGLVLVEVLAVAVLPRAFPSLPFVPLMLVSVWCAVGLVYTWLRLCSHFLTP